MQQDIDEVRPNYAETEAPVKADADPACTVCGGKGWPTDGMRSPATGDVALFLRRFITD